MAGIPLRAAARRPHDPLILMGGVCAFSNPEPVAPFMDFVVVGEGEELEVHEGRDRSEEHTSELQSHSDLVCRLLLEKKKKTDNTRGHRLHHLYELTNMRGTGK